MYMGSGFNWGWMVFGGVMMLLFWGGLISLVVWLVRNSNSSRGQPPNEVLRGLESGIEILDRRYASGEIDREEFEQIKRDLSD